MRNWFFIIVSIALGCQNQPHSNSPIYSQKDDHLTLQAKVNILRSHSSKNDDALFASIALLYAQNKNWSEAEESISKAIKLNPLDASYHLYLANYTAELDDNFKAYNEAKIAFELGAYDKNLSGLIAQMAVETGDTLSGNKFVMDYFQSNKENYDAQLLMARWYLLQKKYSQSYELVPILIETDSMNNEVLKVAYETYLGLENSAMAIKYGNKLIKVDSVNAMYYYQLAKLYENNDGIGSAANYYIKAYIIQPQKESIIAALRIFNTLNMLDSALIYSDSSFIVDNHIDKNVLLMRARAFDKRYKYDESFGVYDRLVKLDTTDSLVAAEREIVQRKIAYLQRRKREKMQLADSLANAMSIINF